MKKLLVLGVMAVLVATGALYSPPSQAQTPSWYFVSVCGSVSPVDCPSGPNPIWFGPFTSAAQCDSSWGQWSPVFGVWPRSLSSCFSY